MYVEHLHLQRSFAFCRVFGSNEKHDLHVHDCLEIGVVLKNELEYRFQDKTYTGIPGDVFLCRPFEPHWSFAKSDKPFECILVLLTPFAVQKLPDAKRLLKPFYSVQEISPLIPADFSFAKAINNAAVSAMAAQEQGDEMWVTRQYMFLIDILLQVEEFFHTKQAHFSEDAPPCLLAEAVGYLLDHYQRPLNIETLIKKAGMGKTLFFKEFRMMTGLSPNEFITKLRVQNAMDLLRSTNQSMIDIAFASGFQSLSTFNKQFKCYSGLSPREYRKQKGY